MVFVEGGFVSVAAGKNELEIFTRLFQGRVLFAQLWREASTRRTPVSREINTWNRRIVTVTRVIRVIS